ncbi:hypothetical protein Gohar_018534, partial [Gossypium harknessii]|nr:hypothetical protein [Gossypium harknessii]
MAFTGIVSDKLNEENYENWKECLESYLKSQGLWGIVSGEEKEPPQSDKNQYDLWVKNNAKALHALQISCGAHSIAKFGGNQSAKYQWDRLAEKFPAPLPQGSGCLLRQGESNVFQYDKLYRKIEKGKVEEVKEFLRENPNALREKITLKDDTALHVAVLAGRTDIVKVLVEMMGKEELEMKNDMGETAFSIATINESRKMVEDMVEKNSNLLTLKNRYGAIPVVVASLFSAKEMVRYLYQITPKEILNPETEDRSGATLLNSLIADGIFDINKWFGLFMIGAGELNTLDLAISLVKTYPKLGVTEDINNNYAIKLLAHKPSAFMSSKSFVFWKRWIYDSCIKISNRELEGEKISKGELRRDLESNTMQHQRPSD